MGHLSGTSTAQGWFLNGAAPPHLPVESLLGFPFLRSQRSLPTHLLFSILQSTYHNLLFFPPHLSVFSSRA